MSKLDRPGTLVDELLSEQQTLTAVEKFSQLHQRQQEPLLAPHYRDLIPLSAPRPGEQYAFEVDLDKCSGCKACVSACHSLNGLDEGESWRDVGALFGERLVPELRGGNRVVPMQQTVTTACHHCVEPACLQGCPVLAYDKDPATGIVRHLGDQCMGCGYCVMKCPYEVPKFSAKRGIVRKCDMCHDRLAVGEAPACVQACPSEAIRITLVRPEAVRLDFNKKSEAVWLADAPQPDSTLPTTRYLSRKPDANLRAADHFNPQPAAAHWPLVLMLVLTQAGIGGMATARETSPSQFAIAFAFFLTGMAASVFHLGQPTKAWRVALGWRTSWLSREAIALGLFGGLAAIIIASRWLPALHWIVPYLSLSLPALGFAVVLAQAMVYADTRRTFWRFASTFPRFAGSAVVLGLALGLCFAPASASAFTLVFAMLAKLAFEIGVLKHADSDADEWTQLRRTAVILRVRLRSALAARLLLGLAGGVLLPFCVATGATGSGLPALALVLCAAGELVERYLFFVAVAPDKMPGSA